jgi:hypothetical protein
MGNQLVTSFKIDEELWKKAKIEAIKRGITTAEFLNQAIINELKR